MNLLDRAIAWVDPAAALRRERARFAAMQVRLAYEGAKTGRRTEGWITSGSSGNAELGMSLAQLRNRSRSLIRDNHYAANACEQWHVYLIGYGVGAQIDNEVFAAAWESWTPQCSADGLPHFEAIQRILARTEFESGEALLRRRYRRRRDRLDIPLQIQTLEPDYLDHEKTVTLADGSGGYIIQGIEFNAFGKRVAYWLFPQHPGEVAITTRRSMVSERVDAADVYHLFDMRRPGMVRGVPRLAPVLLRMRDLDDVEDAYIMLQKVQACMAAFVEQPEGDSLTVNKSQTDSVTGARLEMIEPGSVNYMRPGEKVTFSAPSIASAYGEYKRAIVRDLACGISYPYEILSGDNSQSNYSSSRGGKVGFIQMLESHRWCVHIPAYERVWDWFVEAGEISGALPVGAGVRPQWAPPPIPILDRETEAKADAQELANGSVTWPQLCASKGYTADKQFQEIQEWMPKLRAAGLAIGAKQSDNSQSTPAAA